MTNKATTVQGVAVFGGPELTILLQHRNVLRRQRHLHVDAAATLAHQRLPLYLAALPLRATSGFPPPELSRNSTRPPAAIFKEKFISCHSFFSSFARLLFLVLHIAVEYFARSS